MSTPPMQENSKGGYVKYEETQRVVNSLEAKVDVYRQVEASLKRQVENQPPKPMGGWVEHRFIHGQVGEMMMKKTKLTCSACRSCCTLKLFAVIGESLVNVPTCPYSRSEFKGFTINISKDKK